MSIVAGLSFAILAVALSTKKKIELTADKEINLISKTAIKVEATNAVLFKGHLKHANWTVSK
jgi:hypothetical protein